MASDQQSNQVNQYSEINYEHAPPPTRQAPPSNNNAARQTSPCCHVISHQNRHFLSKINLKKTPNIYRNINKSKYSALMRQNVIIKKNNKIAELDTPKTSLTHKHLKRYRDVYIFMYVRV